MSKIPLKHPTTSNITRIYTQTQTHNHTSMCTHTHKYMHTHTTTTLASINEQSPIAPITHIKYNSWPLPGLCNLQTAVVEKHTPQFHGLCLLGASPVLWRHYCVA